MTSMSLRALRPPALAAPARCEARKRARRLVGRLAQGFVPGRARGVSTLVEWRVDTGGAVERFQLSIRGGRCTLRRRPGQPTVTIGVGLDDLEALVERRVAPTRLFISQRLTVSGDVLMASRLPGFLLA